MSTLIFIGGNSGRGKTTSLRNLPAEETFLINVSGKPLPWIDGIENWKVFDKNNPKERFNYFRCTSGSEVQQVTKIINDMSSNPEKWSWVKYFVIDDYQYVAGHEVLRRSHEKSWDRFNDAGNFYINSLFRTKEDDFPAKYTILTNHLDNPDSNGEVRLKTAGQMINNQLSMEGESSYVLYAEVEMRGTKPRFVLRTKTNGFDTCKTPMGITEKPVDNDIYKFITEEIEKDGKTS